MGDKELEGDFVLQKKVSIVVPVYGVEEYLERCLESLVNQTLKEIEIIVVNDGSPDNSQEIIDRYVKEYPDLVKGYIKENGGLSDARNYGIPYATGEYVAFVDSDDYVDVTMYEKLYNKAKEEDSEVVVCGYFKVNDANKTMHSAQIGNVENYNQSIKECPEILEINAPYAWNKLVKKELLDRTGILFPKGYIFEDICTMYPLIACAKKVSKVNEELYYYIVEREGSITAAFNKSKTLIIKSLRLLNERFKELGVFDECRDSLLTINLRHIYFRFAEFEKYKDRKHQLKLVDESFDLLDGDFPDWRENPGNYKFNVAEYRTRMIKRYKSRNYWKFISIMPFGWTQNYFEKQHNINKPDSELKREYVRYCETRRVAKRKVLVESFHGKSISDSPYYMLKEILKDKRYKVYVTTTRSRYEDNAKFIKENNLNVKLVTLNTKKYMKILATAGYLINNVSFPRCFTKRPNQIYMNTWHGTPLKTLGKNMKKGIESMFNIQHNFLQSTYLLFPNEFTKDCMMEDYNLNKLYTEKTLIAGYPRNAIFKDDNAGEEVREKLGLKDKKFYVYMPTWRGNNSYSQMVIKGIEEILNRFDEQLDEDHLLFVNLHPNISAGVDYDKYKYIKGFPVEIPNYEFINSADALITDYSSIFFDYSITRKPIVLFMYDLEEYMEDRGVYFDIKDLPFQKVYNIDDMCDLLADGKLLNENYDNAIEYFEKFTKHDRADISKILVDYMFYGKKNDCIIEEDYSHNKEKSWKVCIQKKRIDEKEEFDEFINEQDTENTIFAIRNLYFHSLMNKWFYEEYNDKLTYVVYGYNRMLNKRDEKIFLTEDDRHEKARERLKVKARKRAFQRTLPGINIKNRKSIKRII